MTSNAPRNSYRSETAPPPMTRPSSHRESHRDLELLSPGPREYYRESERLVSQPRQFHRESGHPAPQPQEYYRESERLMSQPRQSHRESERPAPQSREYRESERLVSQPRQSHRESERLSSQPREYRESERLVSQPRESHRESVRPSSQLKGSHRDSEGQLSEPRESRLHGSSAVRRTKTTAAPPSKNPFARLVAAGDLPVSNNPFSRECSHGKEPLGSLHRSNAPSHSRSSRHGSSASTICGSPSEPGKVGLTRSRSTAVNSSSTRSTDRGLDPYTGALVPVQGCQTVVDRASSTACSRNQLATTSSLTSSHLSKDIAKGPAQATTQGVTNITYNITNINIGSNNRGGGDPLAGISEIEIQYPSRRHGEKSAPFPHGGKSRVWDLDDSPELVDTRVEKARTELRAYEGKFKQERR